MKYSKEEYENSDIYAGEDGVLNYKSKIVKIRKTHTCVMCQNEIAKGENMLRESGFMDNEPVSCYTCIPCLDKWLDTINECD
jgi:hypothetical protein